MNETRKVIEICQILYNSKNGEPDSKEYYEK